ncbi:MAG: transporter substrate-binding domain-containing protein [Duncaniella sp.]|nr:transporter substrate-binding domain-containing protein [Duncaniella sp.]
MAQIHNGTPGNKDNIPESDGGNTGKKYKKGNKKGGIAALFKAPRGGIILSLALLAVAVVVSVRGCSSSVMNNANVYPLGSGDTINIAIDYSPMSLYRYGDTLGGFNYSMMKEMAAMYGDKIKFHPVSSITDALAELETGKYDIVVSDLPVTAAQREKYRFTEPVYLDNQVLISRDTTLHTALDLAGKPVWVIAGSPAEERMINLSHEIGDTILIHRDSKHNAEQLFMLTAMGEIPNAVVNAEMAEKMMREHPEVELAKPVSFNQFECWAVNKDKKELADTLDARIKRFKTTPQYAELVKRYIDGDTAVQRTDTPD